MNKQEIICVTCPTGCRITVLADKEEIKEITGFECKRGEAYAINEYLHPKRILTSTVKAIGYVAPVISVRTSTPIPKDKLFDCMREIRKIVVSEPFYDGKVIVENFLDTGADLILSNC